MISSDDTFTTQQVDVISKEELSNVIERWQTPHMVNVSDVNETDNLLSLKELEALQQQAQEEGHKAGFEQGHAEGLKHAEQEVQQKLDELGVVIKHLQQPLAELDEVLEQQIMQLAMTMTRQLVGNELKQQPEQVIDAVRHAMKALPIADRKLQIYLNPEDKDIIENGLHLDIDPDKLKWIEDQQITRGGIRIESMDTNIDATVEARLDNIFSELLGVGAEPTE